MSEASVSITVVKNASTSMIKTADLTLNTESVHVLIPSLLQARYFLLQIRKATIFILNSGSVGLITIAVWAITHGWSSLLPIQVVLVTLGIGGVGVWTLTMDEPP